MLENKVLNTEDVLRLIDEAAQRGAYEANLEGLTFGDIDLSNRTIHLSLHFKEATFQGILNLSNSKIVRADGRGGACLDLSKATLEKGANLFGLDAGGIDLKETRSHANIELNHANLAIVCATGLNIFPGSMHIDSAHISEGIHFESFKIPPSL